MNEPAQHPNAFGHPIPDAEVWLVIDPGQPGVLGGIIGAGTDRDRAHELARNIGGVVAKLPIVGDYQQETT